MLTLLSGHHDRDISRSSCAEKTLPPISRHLFTADLIGNKTGAGFQECEKKVLSPLVQVHVYPARIAMGLKRQPDMFTLAENQSFLELEKLIRMALHQSILAYEILVGPRSGAEEMNRDIIVNSFTSVLVSNMDELLQKAENSWGSANPSEHAYQFNLLLSRLALNSGIASIDVSSIVDACVFDGSEEIGDPDFRPTENGELFKKLSQVARKGHTPLPVSPKGYQELSDLLVNLRLK